MRFFSFFAGRPGQVTVLLTVAGGLIGGYLYNQRLHHNVDKSPQTRALVASNSVISFSLIGYLLARGFVQLGTIRKI